MVRGLSNLLEANAKLLAPECTAAVRVPAGFRLSLLTPLGFEARDTHLLDACAVSGCEAELTSVRCGKCCLVRYCGPEHAKLHWPTHKLVCAPAAMTALCRAGQRREHSVYL